MWDEPHLWPSSGRCCLLLSLGTVTHQGLPLQPDQKKAPDSLAGSHISSLAPCTLSPRVGDSVVSGAEPASVSRADDGVLMKAGALCQP